jgi:mRNA interferase MazF
VDGVARGAFVVVTIAGDYGKPRPALVVQADVFNAAHPSVTVIPVSSTIVDAVLFRLTVEPSPANGLRVLSQLMVDKVTTVRRDRLGPAIGQLDNDMLLRVNRAMAVWFGIAA